VIQSAVYYLQRFGLSAAFLWMAWSRISPMLEPRAWAPLVALFAGAPATVEGMLYLQGLAQNVLLVAFNLLVGGLLLLTRRPVRPPERIVHVVVPLVATFSYLGYGFAEHLPRSLHAVALLPDLGFVGIVASGLLVTAAYVLSLLALLYLRRSFAVFVEVRRGVTRGPYRFVRHPMYLGYLMVVTALFLVRPTLGYGLLSVALVVITVVRARLEEELLAAHVPGYADYAERTGMLLPRLRRARRRP
jgi:protein-S-isoprenylcysteine O-methyltransferase Ste14